MQHPKTLRLELSIVSLETIAAMDQAAPVTDGGLPVFAALWPTPQEGYTYTIVMTRKEKGAPEGNSPFEPPSHEPL